MLKPVSILAALLAIAATLATPQSAAAGELAGGDLPEAITVDDELLRLQGAGVFRASMFRVDVFVAGLYLGEAGSGDDKILAEDQRWCLALRFRRDVSQGRLIDVARRALGDRVRTSEGISNLATLLHSIPDAAEGDILTFTYSPERGLELAHNRRPRARITGSEVPRALLASWVGPSAVDGDLSRALLGMR